MTVSDPIFLCGAPRSGTTLLSNLLDWNQKYLVFPQETHLLHLYNSLGAKSLEPYFLRDYLNHPDIRLCIDPAYQEAFDGYLEDTYGPHASPPRPECDRQRFIDTYLGAVRAHAGPGPLPIERVYAALFQAIAEGFPAVRKERPGLSSFIEKRPLDNEMSAILLKERFPKAKFIHILRDPRTRYLSAKTRRIGRFSRCKKICGYDFPTAHSLISATSLQLARSNSEVLKDDYLVIRYEDLVRERRQVMEKVAAFISIPFSEILLKQTSLGLEVPSISSFREKLSGDGARAAEGRLKKFFQATSPLERHILYFYCGDLASEFGYDLPRVRELGLAEAFKLLGPIKNEPLRHYLGNRRRYFRELRQKPRLELTAKVESVLRSWYGGGLLSD